MAITYTIEPGEDLPYIWDDSSLDNKRLVVNINQSKRELNLMGIGYRKPIIYPVSNSIF
jgi:hypothetical protein